jgi:hypothetical protein
MTRGLSPSRIQLAARPLGLFARRDELPGSVMLEQVHWAVVESPSGSSAFANAGHGPLVHLIDGERLELGSTANEAPPQTDEMEGVEQRP